MRGESEDEVVGFARTMRSRAVPLASRGAVDTCGTGGDGAGTFNISTVASFVVAACGVPVAKHGNRSASGTCGSADVLEALGVRIDAPTAAVQRRSTASAGRSCSPRASTPRRATRCAPRKELGVRTAFNLLGPLTNPARPEAQVVGVPRPELVPFVARCLQRLGTKRAWVVHGSGLDELDARRPTIVAEVDGETLRTFTVAPEDAGLGRRRSRRCAAATRRRTRRSRATCSAGASGPRRDVVLLNAAAALLVAGQARSLREGVRLAAAAIDDGRARALVARVREALA